MKYQTKVEKVTAVQWKGWPHKIDGLIEHYKYPQCATLENGYFETVRKGEWIVTKQNGDKFSMIDSDFRKQYEIQP